MQYFSSGCKNIYKDIFKRTIPGDKKYANKPIGGMWYTKYTNINSNAWLMELERSPQLFQSYFSNYGVIVDLKENAKILTIDNQKTEDEIVDAYPYYPPVLHSERKIDYMKLANEYDGIYYTNDTENKLWRVPSLVLTNPDIIEKYNSVDVEFYQDSPYSIDFFISGERPNNIIQNPSKDLELITTIICRLFMEDYYAYDFYTYEELIKETINFMKYILEDYIADIKAILANELKGITLSNYAKYLQTELIYTYLQHKGQKKMSKTRIRGENEILFSTR